MKRKFKIIKIIFFSVSGLCLAAILGIAGVLIFTAKSIDFSADEALFLKAKENPSIKIYYDASGNVTKEEYTPLLFEEVSLSGGGVRIEYGKVSKYLKRGFIAVEDRRFFSHHGVDLKRSLAATLNYIFLSKSNFGGSTITQQVIKNISGDSEKTAKRKIAEIIRAYHLEYSHSKEEIFELYLNIIPMNNGAIGVGEAAKSLFGKEAEDLNIEEAATIIAIANAPSRYDPRRNSEACINKRNKILYVMYTEGVINDEEYRAAKDSKLTVQPRDSARNSDYSWFSRAVIDEVIEDLRDTYDYSYEAAKHLLLNSGASIYSTVDVRVQDVLESYFKNKSNFSKKTQNGLQYSMVISDSQNGVLRGIVGSVGECRTAPYNYASVLRAPGSTLKPLALYLPLIDKGKITWSSIFDDTPASFNKNPDGSYVEYPQNSPKIYDGLTTVADALRLSKNTVAVKLYNMLGAKAIYKYLVDNFEFDTLVYGNGNGVTDLAPSPLALGQLSYGLSLRKLTEAYTVFSREGSFARGRSYIAVYGGNAELLIENEAYEKKICSKEAARVMNQLLSQVTENGTASKITLKNLYDTAGKTGTSGNDIDRFFIGYTPYYTAGIWCGYENKEQSIGNLQKSHIVIWDEIMKEIHEKNVGFSEIEKTFSRDGLIYTSFCKDSGNMFSHNCLYDLRGDRLSYGYFIKGTEPHLMCERHIAVNLDDIADKSIFKEYGLKVSKSGIVSLIKTDGREFPKEIEVSDDLYSFERIKNKIKREEPSQHEQKKRRRRKFWD